MATTQPSSELPANNDDAGPFYGVSSHDAGNSKAPRRSALETRFDILESIMKGKTKPTQIMYSANLSWVSLQLHLRAPSAKGLVVPEATASRKNFSLTQKGRMTLFTFRKIQEELGDHPVATATGPRF